MLEKLHQPFVVDGVEETTNVRIEHPVHLLPRQSHPQRVQRIVLAAPGTEPVREPQEILLVDLVEDFRHRTLDDLVFQRCDSERALTSVRLRYVRPLGGFRSVGPSVNSGVEIPQTGLQVFPVFFPRLSVHPRCCPTIECVVALPELIRADMVQKGGEPLFLLPACRFPHTLQAARHAVPAPCPERGRLQCVPLGRSPSLHALRRRWRTNSFVRALLRYYGTVRLPDGVHVGRAAFGFLRPAHPAISGGRLRDLPLPARGASTRTRGL